MLVLLSSTKKNGELRVTGGRIDGQVWLEKGQIVQSAIGGQSTSAVDGLFQLLRLEEGTFNFDSDSTPAERSAPESIDLVLTDAQVRLGEWNDIARVVPHLDALVDMAADAPADEVVVTRQHWRLLREVAGGRSVHELMAVLGDSEFDTCRTVKELVDAKLASIDATPASSVGMPVDPAAASAAAAELKALSEAASKKSDEGHKGSKAASSSARGAAKSDEDEAADALAELIRRPAAKGRAGASNGSDSDSDGSKSDSEPAKAPDTPIGEARALVAQLAALSGDDEEVVAAVVTEHLAHGGELPEVPEGDEPINRGLLLKFLSSVRN